jgi:phosphopantothenoylcysteine decarboxylase/phosphopantothenate--cysteine ligase
MGCALAAAALDAGHEVVVISGPVNVTYPAAAEVIEVVTTDEMLAAAVEQFPSCDGAIGVAAPCDFAPLVVAREKIKKTDVSLTLELGSTPDIMMALGKMKRGSQWTIGFALETENGRANAIEKLRRKQFDLIVLNAADAMGSKVNSINVIDQSGELIREFSGSKADAAVVIVEQIANL